jgi:hypothetical protein
MADDARFRANLSDRGQHMLDNLLVMRASAGDEVGYSLAA